MSPSGSGIARNSRYTCQPVFDTSPVPEPVTSRDVVRHGSSNCQIPIAPAISRMAAATGSAFGAR
jgi:hypothetical protein